MRILFTNTGPWGTGSFTLAKALAESFEHLGHEIKIFFPDRKAMSDDQKEFYENKKRYHIWPFPLEDGKTKIDYFPLMIPDPHPRNPKRNTFSQLSDQQLQLYLHSFEKQISKVIEEYQPDVIECQHIWAMDHIIQKLGHRYFCTAHHSDQMGFRFDPRMRKAAISSAKKAEKIFAISDYVKQDVCNLYDLEEKKVVVIENGYDQKMFQPTRSCREKVLSELGLQIPDRAFLVSFAGKISKTKGIDVLLKANRLLSKKANIHFLICGSGDIEEVLGEECRSQFSFDHMHFIGHQTPQKLSQIHNISDCSVLPSRTEGFGIACLEAMGCGLPMVFTESGGMSDYAVGIKVEKENPIQLAEGLLELKTIADEKKSTLSQEAYQVAKKFSWDTIANKRLFHYQNL
ncbi:MAG: glycosyltransferase family 4 protein [Candidatus Algichlamydia australiensis]|nr:glycosyltransferase family 4 protein [Chlamydiales bacterium]